LIKKSSGEMFLGCSILTANIAAIVDVTVSLWFSLNLWNDMTLEFEFSKSGFCVI
jgi:hypothetical protein